MRVKMRGGPSLSPALVAVLVLALASSAAASLRGSPAKPLPDAITTLTAAQQQAMQTAVGRVIDASLQLVGTACAVCEDKCGACLIQDVTDNAQIKAASFAKGDLSTGSLVSWTGGVQQVVPLIQAAAAAKTAEFEVFNLTVPAGGHGTVSVYVGAVAHDATNNRTLVGLSIATASGTVVQLTQNVGYSCCHSCWLVGTCCNTCHRVVDKGDSAAQMTAISDALTRKALAAMQVRNIVPAASGLLSASDPLGMSTWVPTRGEVSTGELVPAPSAVSPGSALQRNIQRLEAEWPSIRHGLEENVTTVEKVLTNTGFDSLSRTFIDGDYRGIAVTDLSVVLPALQQGFELTGAGADKVFAGLAATIPLQKAGVWTMYSALFTAPKGGHLGFAAFLARRNVGEATVDILVSHATTSFTFAPDLVILQTRSTTAWVFHSYHTHFEFIPHAMTPAEGAWLMAWMEGCALKSLATFLGVPPITTEAAAIATTPTPTPAAMDDGTTAPAPVQPPTPASPQGLTQAQTADLQAALGAATHDAIAALGAAGATTNGGCTVCGSAQCSGSGHDCLLDRVSDRATVTARAFSSADLQSPQFLAFAGFDARFATALQAAATARPTSFQVISASSSAGSAVASPGTALRATERLGAVAFDASTGRYLVGVATGLASGVSVQQRHIVHSRCCHSCWLGPCCNACNRTVDVAFTPAEVAAIGTSLSRAALHAVLVRNSVPPADDSAAAPVLCDTAAAAAAATSPAKKPTGVMKYLDQALSATAAGGFAGIVSVLKSGESTSVGKQLVSGQGLSYVNEHATLTKFIDVEDEGLPVLANSIPSMVGMSETSPMTKVLMQQIELAPLLKEEEWMKMGLTFKMGNGGMLQYSTILASHNATTKTSSWLVIKMQAEFKLAPYIYVMQHSSSFLGGLWSSSSVSFKDVPRGLTTADVAELMMFFDLASLMTASQHMGVPFTTPALPKH